jgi:hypothetical protein
MYTFLILALMACNKPVAPQPIDPQGIVIYDMHEDVDGRKLFTVVFPDGKALEHMYAEEIAHGLKTGKWEYNEDLTIEGD